MTAAMAPQVHLDTHILIWLYADTDRAWPPRVRELLDCAVLRYSPMAELELGHLHEIGRVRVPSARLLGTLEPVFALKTAGEPFADVAADRPDAYLDPRSLRSPDRSASHRRGCGFDHGQRQDRRTFPGQSGNDSAANGGRTQRKISKGPVKERMSKRQIP